MTYLFLIMNIVKQVNENAENITFGQPVHRYEFGIIKVHFGLQIETN